WGGLILAGDGDLDDDLLALADHEQVGVLDHAGQRVHVDLLGQRELLLALDVQREDGVGARVAQDRGELERAEQQVAGLGVVAVEHGGDQEVAAGAARGALAELGTDGGGELVGVSHAMTSSFAFPDTAHNAPRRNAEVIASTTERPRGSSLAEMTRPA